MNAPDWSNPKTRTAWFMTYMALRNKGEEYYFSNGNGFLRCHGDAQAGKSPGPEHWALFVAERMKG